MTDIWYGDHSNLVMLTAWLADHGRDAQEVAYAVEKPWDFEEEYREARAEHNAEVDAERAKR